MHFSNEQVQRAREVSLVDFIRSNEGWTIQKVGNWIVKQKLYRNYLARCNFLKSTGER